MKPIKWVLRAVGIGFFLSLFSTAAVSLRNSRQPFIPRPRLSFLQWFSLRFLGGVGTKKDPFERAHKASVVWENFREEVSDRELRRLDEEFVEPILGGILDFVLRRGHGDVGVEETSGQHTRSLRELDEQYQDPMSFDSRELLELRLMHGVHEMPEVVTFDTSRFLLPTGQAERRKRIKAFKPISLRKERERLRREWKRERPFVFIVTAGLDDRQRRIVLYLFDRFYLSRDRAASFGRQLHYFQPAYDIREQTNDPLIIKWFLQVAFAYLTNERLRGDLAAVHDVKEPVRADTTRRGN